VGKTIDRRYSMLTLTLDATDAIEGILNAPGIPEGAGIRIAAAAPTSSAAAASELQVTVAAEPDDSDQLIEVEGARVFVEDTVADALEDKQLDTDIVDERVRFSLADQS
jgi:iron-sulfur cluster assembly protein